MSTPAMRVVSDPLNQTLPANGGFWETLSGFGGDVFETITEKGAQIVDGLAEFEYQKWMAENIGDAKLQSGTTNTAQNANGQPSSQQSMTATQRAVGFVSDNALIIGGVVVGGLALTLLLRR